MRDRPVCLADRPDVATTCPIVRTGCPAVRRGRDGRVGRRALGRAPSGPPDRCGVFRLRAELAVGGRGAAVARDRGDRDAGRPARHRVPPDRARRLLGARRRRSRRCGCSEGDLIVFPQGDAHVLSSAPGMRASARHVDVRCGRRRRCRWCTSAVAAGPIGRGSSAVSSGCDERPFNPLLTALPRVIHLSAAGHERRDRMAGDAAEHRGAGIRQRRARVARTSWRACPS